jgi:predicted DCC family thiol-disulfide oxidoreductase YuxK
MDAAMPTVFYDGQCRLCCREISHYRSLRGADRLMWIDITDDEETLHIHGLQRETVMARFHVRDAAGNWHIGARGFIELWSHLPVYSWLSRIIRALRLENTLDWIYTRFADWRLGQRCKQGSCNAGLRSK